MSKVKKPSSLGFAFRYIWKFDKSLIFIEMLIGFIMAVFPLINIYIPAKIIGIISTSKDIASLIIYSAIAILGNATLLIARNLLQQTEMKKKRLLFMKETNDLSFKVYKVEYPNLEDAKFEGDFNKYKMYGESPYFTLLWLINSIVKGLIGLALSIAMISPFFKVVFKTTGTGFLHSPWYGVMIIGIVLLVSVIVLVTSSIINKKCYNISNTYASYNRMFSFFQERLNDYNSGKDVRIFAQQDLIFNSAMGSILDKGVALYNKIHSLTAKQSGMIAVVGALVGFGVYSIIGLKGLAGFLSIESLVLCVGGMMQVVSGITSLGSVAGRLNMILPRIHDFNEIMEKKDEVDSGQEFDVNFKKISANNISFRYKEDLPQTLTNISFDIIRGEKIALVGQNGSGKSTFIKLLCGLYPPTDGGFMLDGKAVNGYNSKAWREMFSVVFQDSTMFSLPMSHNIAGGEKYEVERLEKCLEQVGLKERATNLPNGYDSYLYKHVEDNGIEISGGEAQRMAMARALYKDAPIMILDEPTAALDPFAEQEIYNKFNELTADKTVFYISHRLSSCYFCDKIAVFDQGNLIQFGTHNELMEDKAGKYYILWTTQAQYYINSSENKI